MARRSKTSGKAKKAKVRKAGLAKRRNTAKTKRRIAPAASRGKPRTIPDLSKDLKEAREQQAATAEILKVIASSPSNVQPVFEAIVRSAAKLFEPCAATITTLKDDKLYWGATAASISGFDVERVRSVYPIPFDPDRAPSARAMLERRIVEIPDIAAPATPEFTRNAAAAGGFRSITFAPLVDREQGIGTIIFTHPQAGFTYSERQLALIQTFADQAVIAIQNARLFNEVQARTRDVEESLQQQTATADVLKVISRSAFDLGSVMNTLTHSAAELCKAEIGALYLHEGDVLVARGVAHADSAQADFLRRTPLETDSSTYVGRTIIAGAIRNIADVANETDIGLLKRFSEILSFRSILFVPLMREGGGIGVFALARKRTGQFSQRDVDLIQAFADQAVIAIENVRLFNEVQARTNDLREALTYQTGSGKILNVIASSPTDINPVLQAIVESACELCQAYDAIVLLKDGDDLRFSAHHGSILPETDKWPINRDWTAGRAYLDRKPVHVRDLLSDEGKDFPDAQELSRRGGTTGLRSILGVPLLREGESIGAIVLRRTEVHPFSDKQISLLQTFADQAVIAIENARLFNETREALEQQTATSEVLQVISSTPGDLEPVFKTILENATHICGANFGLMNLCEEGRFRSVANYNVPAAYTEWLTTHPPFQPHPQSGLGTVARTTQVVHVADIRTLPAYLEGDPSVLAIADLAMARSYFVVPMLKESELIGAITIYRQEVKPFAEKQSEVVGNFANQAVIAIENARLLNELRERTIELTRSLEELRNAQDRLIQTEKLASLGQLTAGIAHEIKNPLNFVNNFAALSAELTDELKDVLAPASLADKIRGDVDELTGLLKENLQKVVQHGKRADSIVKNMLLHSRQGTGEHRRVDLNGLVDESLNLAYHGARAEKPTFNVILSRDFDPEAGTVELFPQEITRVLLNLISNGFYAVAKRAAEAGASFEPELTASTRGNSDHVEICIRDNGTGIPAEVQEKMFNPFFTTKPAGEGTGLGLSMTHDIIVKQHGGRIEVATEPGKFTEFTIVLPRNSAVSAKDGGET
jgi:two-component system, NtrC family, sensor kinase